MTLHAGDHVGHYEIHSALGAGGMGEVYRARDSRLGRDVALKVLPDSVAADAERIARFEREAQILAALSHASIAAIYGLEISGPVRVLVMELVEGESLEARLRRGPLPLDEALAIAQQIGDALSAAHDRGIVHRDLKPGNIMLTPDGGVKVLDFGLARMVEPDVAVSGLSMSPTHSIQATLAGTILGTAPYMSPEQARGRAVDKRTDVWALGCVLFEMLTGTRAFDGDDVTETIATIVKGDADWNALDAIAPPHVVSIVRCCLAKDPKQRFADINVPLYLLAHPAPTGAASRPINDATPIWRRSLPVVAATVAAVLLTGAAAWYTRPSPAAAVTRFTIGLGDVALTNTGRQALAISPDGSRIVYTANRRLYARSMADAEPRLITGLENVKGYESGTDSDINIWLQDLAGKTASRRLTFAGRNTAPVWSPDSRWIAFRSDREGDEAIFRQRADGTGAAERLTKPEAGTKHTPHAWSPDGARLVFETEKDGRLQLHALSLVDRTSSRFGDATSAVRMEPSFSPDGRWLAYQRSDQSGRVLQAFVEPFPATGAKYLLPVSPVAGAPVWSREGDRLIVNASATNSIAVDFHATPSVAFGPPVAFPRLHRTEPNPATGRRNSDALPGGKLLGISIDLAQEGSARGFDQIAVVLNWTSELARLSR